MIWTAMVIEALQGCTARMRGLIGSVGPVTSVSSLGLSVSVPRGWDLKLEKNWVRAGQWMDCIPQVGGFGLTDFLFWYWIACMEVRNARQLAGRSFVVMMSWTPGLYIADAYC